MSKATVSYVCNECGGHTLKWQGQCPSCGAWNTLAEGSPPPVRRGGYAAEVKGLKLADVRQADVERMGTGIAEFDRVLASWSNAIAVDVDVAELLPGIDQDWRAADTPMTYPDQIGYEYLAAQWLRALERIGALQHCP